MTDRTFTGAGFLSKFERSNEARLFEPGTTLQWGKVGAKLNTDKLVTGYIVYVDDGYGTTSVEGYKYGESWPERVEHIELYNFTPGMDLSAQPGYQSGSIPTLKVFLAGEGPEVVAAVLGRAGPRRSALRSPGAGWLSAMRSSMTRASNRRKPWRIVAALLRQHLSCRGRARQQGHRQDQNGGYLQGMRYIVDKKAALAGIKSG